MPSSFRRQPPGQGNSAEDRPVQLSDVVITRKLGERPNREPDWKEQGIALGTLARAVATSPERVVNTLLEMAVRLCAADTAGLSVQETTPSGEQIFRWTHLAGRLKEHIGDWTPRNFSPCGLCLDTNAPQLFSHPEHYFTYLAKVGVPFVEVLMIPVRVGRDIPALIWIVSHTTKNGFDAEDVRIMSELADFTGCVLGLLPPGEAYSEGKKSEAALQEALNELLSLSKARSAHLQQLSLKLINAQDEERRQIAQDLRDRAGHHLAALAMTLSVLLREKASLTSSQQSRLDDSLQMVHRCTSEIRTISSLLHPPSLDEAGLFTAITWYVEGFTQRSGIRIDFDCPPELGRFPREVEMAIFRAVQEGLTNIERHSGSPSANIRIREAPGEVRIEIRDEGRGISPAALSGILQGTHLAGVGMAAMRERTGMLGGTFHVRSSSDGTSIELAVPVASQLLKA